MSERRRYLEGRVTFLEEMIAKYRGTWTPAFLEKWQQNLRRAKARLKREFPNDVRRV